MGAMTDAILGGHKTLYDADYHAWTQDQAAKLRNGDFAQLDVVNLVEEIESLGRSEERELESRLALVLMHLLKWQYQPYRRSHSWTDTLREQRKRVERLLKRMPSLRPRLADAVLEAYGDGRLMAERETGQMIRVFPETCPYTVDQVMQPDWLPPD